MTITRPYKWSIEKIRKLAAQHGGKCLSVRYKNPREKLLWICKKGHKWRTNLDSVRRGSWCLQCRKNRPLSITDLRETAAKRDGKLISTTYKNSQQKLTWECRHGHQWLASANYVRRGSWCPICARHLNESQQLQKMRKLANQYGGVCISTVYKDIKSKLQWECAKGHRWEATPALVRMGYWCRICSGKNPRK